MCYLHCFDVVTDVIQQPAWTKDETLELMPRNRSLSQSMAYRNDVPILYRSNPNLMAQLPLFPPETLPRDELVPIQSKHGSRSDHMNLSDDEDTLLSSLLTHEIGEFVLKIDAAEATLRA